MKLEKRLIDKLSAKWVRVGDRKPEITYNTLLFKGGIPEPTVLVWYNKNRDVFIDVYKGVDIFVSDDSCWLDYGNSDYPNIKF